MGRSNPLAKMKDVAERAGVSVATVSCALSGKKNVSQKTRAKIQAAIDELHYIPNAAARDLKMQDNHEIGIILTDIDDSYHADLLHGISSEMQKNGYNVNIALSGSIDDVECEKIDLLIGKKVAGLVILSCQRNGEAYFESRIHENRLPAVFVERRPEKLGLASFAAFDNRRIVSAITARLLELGYRDISLVLGDPGFSCERESLEGFTEAMKNAGLEPDPSRICHTAMSKESTFKTTMYAYEEKFPEAIITTSTTIAKGVLETAHIARKTVPDDVIIISLGEETWCRSNHLGNVITTSRSAVTLGSKIAELLIQNIKSPYLFEGQVLTMTDNFDPMRIRRPAPPARPSVPVIQGKRAPLNVMMMDINTANAIRLLTNHFSVSTGIDVNITHCADGYRQSSDDLLNPKLNLRLNVKWIWEILHAIEKENEEQRCLYDIYMYDIPWLSYIASHNLLADLTEYVENRRIVLDNTMDLNLRSCIYGGRYYGIPIMGGSQLLFYRRDFFEDPFLNKEFEKKYKVPLRTPRTWTEFNGICEFFTRSINPLSPVDYGTSVAAKNPEELINYILPCMWAHGGKLYDDRGVPCIDSTQNIRAYKSILQMIRYTDGNLLDTDLKSATIAFAQGKTAMLANFSEYVSFMNSSANFAGKVGYTYLPGKHSVLPGWNFGVSKYTDKMESILEFFNWIQNPSVSYYMTLLDGQTTVREPFENNELKRLYPWLPITRECLKYCHRRETIPRPGGRVIPQNKVEAIIVQIVYDVCCFGFTVEQAAQKAQEEMVGLFRSYGY